MRTIANAFLILFLNAAALSLADALLGKQLGITFLASLSSFATGLAVLLGLFLYPAFALNKHLPKLILVPPLAYLLWGMLNFWPLEYLAGEGYRFYAAVAQMLIGLLVLQLNLTINKKSRLLVLSQFAGPGFSGRNLLRFILVNIPLFPIVMLVLSFATADNIIDEATAGFVRLKPNGLYMVEKNYRRVDKSIRLTGMIHLGQREYYKDLADALQGRQAILLAEGVTDETGRLEGKFSYRRIADLLGLTAQEQMPFPGRLISADSLDRLDDQSGTTDILPSDIDLREFDDRTIAVLNALGKYLLNNNSLADGFHKFNQWAEKNTTSKTNQIVMDDLVYKRNRAALRYLPKAIQKYDTVVIPWGALHMPGIEQAILAKGFRLSEQQEHLSIDFLLLPYEQLWANLSESP